MGAAGNVNNGGSASAHGSCGCGNFDDGVGQSADGADEKLHNGSIKLRICATLQLGECVRGIPRFLVGAVAGNRIVSVGNCDNAGSQRNSLSAQGLWIT